MKLDRNINENGRGKYAVLNLRKLDDFTPPEVFAEIAPRITAAMKTLEEAGILDWGTQGTDREFFLIRLKDKYAGDALAAYGLVAAADDPEYGGEILEMAARAGTNSPWCKAPD